MEISGIDFLRANAGRSLWAKRAVSKKSEVGTLRALKEHADFEAAPLHVLVAVMTHRKVPPTPFFLGICIQQKVVPCHVHSSY